MYAVVQSGSQQFKVQEGDTFTVDHLDAAVGTTVELDQVVLLGGDTIQVGTPTVAGAKVTAEVVGHSLGDKRITYRYRRTRSYRKIRGSRPHLTHLKVTGIQA
jgi:large subunit ribosomal protein L21